MLSRSQIKHLHSLRIPKYRGVHREFTAEGVKLAEELLESSFHIKAIYALGTWLEANRSMAERRSPLVAEVSESELSRISNLVTPNQVFLLCGIPGEDESPEPAVNYPALVLCDIQDPGNLGTIIRTADWFGIDHIVCSSGTADLYNPKVIQSTMGSFTRVRVYYHELGGYLGSLPKDVTICGAVTGGSSIYESGLKEKSVILIGNESRGIPEELMPLVTEAIGIPSYSAGAESLNAGVAAAIIMAEFKRRGQSR